MSSRMKSSNSVPDFVWMFRFSASIDVWLRDQIGDDRRIVVDRRVGTRGRHPWLALRGTRCGWSRGRRFDEIAPLDEGHEGVLDERIGSAQDIQQDAPAGR